MYKKISMFFMIVLLPLWRNIKSTSMIFLSFTEILYEVGKRRG